MMSFNLAQCPTEDKLQLLLSTEARGQSTSLSSSKLSQNPLHFSFGHNASFVLERGRESKFLSTCICPNSAGQTPASVPMNVFIQRTGHTSREITV